MIAAPAPPTTAQPIGFGERVMVGVLDIVLFVLICAVGLLFRMQDLPSDLQNNLGTALFAAYYVIPEWRFGKTLGKRLCGLRVQRLDGSNPTLLQALGRLVVRCLMILLGIGVLPLYVAFRLLGRRMPQDAWTRTTLVRVA